MQSIAEKETPWNWCQKCEQTVDDDMRTGEFRDGSEGTCIGCKTVYVAYLMTDESWALVPADEPAEDREKNDPVHEVKCMGCGLPYAGPAWLDLVIPREQWLLIHPDDGGILCANCLIARASKLPHVINITGRITFGSDYDDLEAIDLTAIMTRHAATTLGDWRECGADRGGCTCGLVWAGPDRIALNMSSHCDDELLPDHKANVRFTAHAHQDIPALVQRVDFLRGALNYANSRYDTAEGELAILKSRLAAVEVELSDAAERFYESTLPVERAAKPTAEEVEAWGREFEASAVRMPRRRGDER